MIEAKGLTKYFGQIAAIENVDFSVQRGEIIGFLGPNGAGKTTTMRILTGFSPASKGSAKIAGFDVADQPIEVKRRVGYLPENVPLYQEMVVQGFLRYVAEVKGVPRVKRTAEVQDVIERCGLKEMAKRIIANLSKGYRQRVGLAQALIGNPPVLVLDEPTVGLDPRQIIEIRQMIKDLAQDHTVLLSTHILPEVQAICERVIIINRGRIVAQDTMENLAGAKSGQTLLEVDTGGPEPQVLAALQNVQGVQSVTVEGPGCYLVNAGAGGPVREAVANALVHAGYSLHGLRERRRTLEEVFVEAVATDEGESV
jgi:gliding motility-associated transport system ATP-binding protein